MRRINDSCTGAKYNRSNRIKASRTGCICGTRTIDYDVWPSAHIVNAIGNTLPPDFILSRARFHETMLIGAPAASIEFANCSISGWRTGPLFLEVLEHIKNFTRCATEDRILITMDNHESHCTLDAFQYSRANVMIVDTSPHHSTHRMQSLNVVVNRPFKQS